MIVYPLESHLVKPGDSITKVLFETLKRHRLVLRTGDIVVVSSKVVAVSKGRVRGLDTIKPTKRAKALARKYSMSPSFVQVVLDEADRVIGGVSGALLTVKNGDATANAGIDMKNAPKNSVVLWPDDPDRAARGLRKSIEQRSGIRVGVVIVDSRVAPLRLGTTGFAIGLAGFQAVKDLRGVSDLTGRHVRITFQAIADGVAAAAQLVMGEVSERKPFVVLRGSPVALVGPGGIREARLALNRCLYMSQIMRVPTPLSRH